MSVLISPVNPARGPHLRLLPLLKGTNHISPSQLPGRRLNLLAAGMTDQAAARHLQLSYRTTRRRVAELMVVLGAQSRFQAGVQAAHKGWVLPLIL